MMCLSGTVINQPVMSLQTGDQIATVTQPIINPDNLKIEAFYVKDIYSSKQLVLVFQDLREIMNKGLVVDDYSVLTEPEDLVRLKKIMDINFELLGKPVHTVSKEKVGKVNDFALDSKTLYIQKLYVDQSLIKSFSGGSLSIDRTQIHEITNRRIIISDLLGKNKASIKAPAAA